MAVKKTETPEAIEPEAFYALTVVRPFSFGGVDFAPLAEMEVSGEFLSSILSSDKADNLRSYNRKG